MMKEKNIQFHPQNNGVSQEKVWDKIYKAQESGIKNLSKILENNFDLDKNQETAIDIIQQSSFEEIVAFLSKIKEYPDKYSLPQWLIDNVSEKFFSGWEKLPKEERDSIDGEDIMMILITTSHHHGKFKYSGHDEQSITDKFFLSFVRNIEKHQVAGQDYWKDLSHGADSVRPDILIKGLAEITNNENVHIFIHLLSASQGFKAVFPTAVPGTVRRTASSEHIQATLVRSSPALFRDLFGSNTREFLLF